MHASSFTYPEDRTVLRSVAMGVVVGLPLGMLVGGLIVALGQSLAGLTPTPLAVLFAGAFGGSLAGIFFGSVVGVAHCSKILYQDEVGRPEPEHELTDLPIAHRPAA
jgi:uncharacterized membrane protein YedE/YeeE